MSERPDKVEPVEYKMISDPVDQLDTILNLLNHDDEDSEGFDEIRYRIKLNRLRISDKDLEIAVGKLCDDKYLSWVTGSWVTGKKTGDTADNKYFFINYHGRLFLKRSFPYKNRPYKNQLIIQRIQGAFTITKTFITISYSLIILVIAYWGIKLTDKTNRLEQKIEEQGQKEERLEFKIDSLTKLTNDTTRNLTTNKK